MSRSISLWGLAFTLTMIAGCGGGGGSGGDPPPPEPVTGGPPRLEFLAGAIAGAGSNDGEARFARLFHPHGVAVDVTGRLFIADTLNRTIRVLAGGQVTTLAGLAGAPGFTDGQGSAARFNNPEDLVVDPAGNIYVADTLNHAIRRIAPDGNVTTLAGNGTAGHADGTGSLARFNRPTGIARDAQGTLFVADSANHVIRVISPNGTVTTLAGMPGMSGFADGAASAARFSFPRDVAVDSAGGLLVADGNLVLRRIAAGVVMTVAGSPGMRGAADGVGAQARFSQLGGIATDGAGNTFVTDDHRVRRVDAAGTVTTIAGPQEIGITGARDGAGTEARFHSPRGIAVTGEGLVVADADNETLRRVTLTGAVTTLVGDFTGRRFSGLGFGARDGPGLIVSDGPALHAVSPEGNVSTLASHPQAPGLETVRLYGVAIDASGALVTAVQHCQVRFGPGVGLPQFCTGAISRAGADGTFVVVAGSNTQAGGGDGIGANARFQEPYGLAADSSGVLYVADAARDTIRRIARDGSVTTLAGRDDSCPPFRFGAPPALSDGVGAAATFCMPRGVAVDVAGNVYVADAGYVAIRKISPAGAVSTLAGGGGNNCTEGSGDGVGAAARFCSVRGLAIDAVGVVYVADGSTVRRISPAGEVTTLAGIARDSGFVPGALPGRLTGVVDVVVSGPDLYVIMSTAVAVIRNRP